MNNSSAQPSKRKVLNSSARYGPGGLESSPGHKQDGNFLPREVEVFNGYKERLKESLMQEEQRSLMGSKTVNAFKKSD